jgi:uncharacterized repeat protein (TIGR03843 family)
VRDSSADAEALHLLEHGRLDVEGRMPWSSNATFLVNVFDGNQTCAQAIYKPIRGERPLWDFPSGLHRREVAAYRLSVALGWGIVPPTILREGPFGDGSLQLFVPSDFEQHYFTLHENRPDLHPQLKAICAFDILANNADRKGGHCLLGLDGRVHAIDNGLCFAADFKLRTVIWEFSGQRVPKELLDAIARVARAVPVEVAALLDDEENEAIRARASALLARGVFPIDASGHRYPWPMV